MMTVILLDKKEPNESSIQISKLILRVEQADTGTMWQNVSGQSNH